MAICKVFRNYCKDNAIQLHQGNFSLSYDTNIPRQVQSLLLQTPFLDACTSELYVFRFYVS